VLLVLGITPVVADQWGKTLGASLAALFVAAGGLAFALLNSRYFGILGAGSIGSLELEAYDNLRESLSGGNLAARLYADWLKAFLDAVDQCFGDVGKADGTLFPHAFGLRTPAPLWTAPAFDRCLTMALIYPIATIFIIWAISGHVGPAETALGLNDNLSAWRRGLASALIGLSLFAAWRARRTKGMKSMFWVAFAVAVAIVFALAVTFAVAGGGVDADARAATVVLALSFAVAGGGVDADARAATVVLAVSFAVAFAGAGAARALSPSLSLS